MMKAASKASKQGKVKNSLHDKTFTPRAAVAATMQILDIEKTDHCLDPGHGGGAFYEQFACDEDHKYYCEIDEGIDFLTWQPPLGVKAAPAARRGWPVVRLYTPKVIPW